MKNNDETIQAMLEKFLPFAQERLGFKNLPEIRLESDEDNAQQPLGKTAYYDPSQSAVTVYVSGRHPKDIMRSISHELVHHTQNGRGEFEKVTTVGEGYAQSDDHLREMEREAYEQGNLCFRDWEDSIKTQNEELNMFQKRNKKINEGIMKKFGYGTVTEGDDWYSDEHETLADKKFADSQAADAQNAEESVTLDAEELVTLLDLATRYKAGDEYDTLEELENNQELMDKVYSVFGHECPGDNVEVTKCLMDSLVETNPWIKEGETLKRVVDDAEEGEPVDAVECPDGTMKEKGLVAGEDGGIAGCPDEEPEMEMEPEEELEEEAGFDKDFGDEFEYLFVEAKEDEDDTDDVDDDGSMGDPVPYLEENGAGCGEIEEEPEIVVTVGEGLYLSLIHI